MLTGFTATVVFILGWLGELGVRSAYRNGVRDTFYELNEPGHPGAKRVRELMEREHLRLEAEPDTGEGE